jgi:hypothetical protein
MIHTLEKKIDGSGSGFTQQPENKNTDDIEAWIVNARYYYKVLVMHRCRSSMPFEHAALALPITFVTFEPSFLA